MGRTDEAALLVHAPAAWVWAACTDPRQLELWLPPVAMTATVEHFDARPGGTYRMVLTYPPDAAGAGKSSAATDVVEGRFLDLVPPHRLVQAVDFESADPDFAGTMVMTWELIPRGEATLVVFRAQDVPPGIAAVDHAQGLTESLVGLARHLSDNDGKPDDRPVH